MAKHDCGNSEWSVEDVKIDDIFGSEDCLGCGAFWISVSSITRVKTTKGDHLIFGGKVLHVEYPKYHHELNLGVDVFWAPQGLSNNLEESMMDIEELLQKGTEVYRQYQDPE